jgi:membrane protease YdiL (CAAX protease family)
VRNPGGARGAVPLLVLGLLAYNAVVSLGRVPELWSIFTNLTLGGLLFLVCRAIGLSWDEVGLRKKHLVRWLLLGSALGVLATLAASFASSSKLAEEFSATQVELYEGWRLAVKLLIHIPIATALVEEFAFRGVLFGLWMRTASTVRVVFGTSIFFALWHVPSTLAKNPPCVSLASFSSLRNVGLSMLGTLLLGLALALARLWTGSIWAGVPFHAGFNAGGVIGTLLRR